jgi:hypothetical protein
MYRFWKLIFLIALFPSAVNAAEPWWLQDGESCGRLTTLEAKGVCDRIIRSREILHALHPKLVADKHGNAIAREVILIAWDVFESPHEIVLTLPLRPTKGRPYIATPVTPGYAVERLRGTGPYKLEFRVVEQSTGRELRVYGGKHLWIPPGHSHVRSYQGLMKVVEEKQYLPFLDHLHHPELVDIGFNYLNAMAERAQNSLQHVPSRAFPDRMLADVYPSEMVVNLVMSEHTDPFKLFDEKTSVTLPRSSYLNGVLVELAIHGSDAFARLCSHANACGWTQFTNTPMPSKRYPGTYTLTYNKCRTPTGAPVLNPDFFEGTRNPLNALKAALCYLDIENASLPQKARMGFLDDPKRGSIYMLVAYHSGGSVSKSVFAKVEEMRKRLGEQWSLDHETLPKSLFQVGKRMNPHAHWYIKKYLLVWERFFPDTTVAIPVTVETAY